MKKITAAAKKSAPKFINDTDVQVTREFAKKARIFGTPEYKVWREIKKDCPDAVMVLKTIKKNPSKRTSTKNMTYVPSRADNEVCSDVAGKKQGQ